jgi:matrixin
MSRRTGLLATAIPILLAVAALMVANPAFSYLNDYQSPGSGTPFVEMWIATPQWTLNPAPPSGKMVGDANAVRATVAASFATWTAAPNTSTIVTQVSKAGETNITNENTPHNFNLVCFVCTGANFSTDGTLAITLTTATVQNNQSVLSQADIIFNPNPSGMCFIAVANPTQPPNPGTCPSVSDAPQDLQTVLTHEVGHFFGLDHSAVVAAMMFPFAPPLRTSLGYDDVAGISSTYPGPQVIPVGSISGTVSLGGGTVFGAHVFANSTTATMPLPTTIRKTPIGTLTRPDGTYTINAVPADTYTVYAEPLDLPVSNSDVSGYASAFGQASVQTNFTTRPH